MPSVIEVKGQFESILTLRSELATVFEILEGKLDVLKNIFAEIVKNHGHKGYVFGIDSFSFQNRLIETDVVNLKTIFRLVDNRVYCEYYNLYLQVKKYGSEVMKGLKTMVKNPNFDHVFPAFKHLDKNVHYDIDVVQEMQTAVTCCLTDLEAYYTTKSQELNNDEAQSACGLNIDNLVYTEMTNNAILKARIDMFYRYLAVFHEHHSKYYTRLLLKVKLHLGIVNEDIQIKQFNQQTITSSGLEGMPNIKTGTSPVAHMDANEEAKLRSYVNYEDMRGSRRDVLDGIVAATGSDNDSDRSGTPVRKDSVEESLEDPKEIVELAIGDNKSVMEESELASNIGELACQFTEEDINKRCMVEGYECIGTIRFIGEHVHAGGMRVGVELDEAVGRNNGTVREHEYFKCEENKGVLCAPHKVSLVDNETL